jgi:hypothetical protein
LQLLPAYLACVIAAGLLWQRPGALLGVYCVLAAVLLWRWHTRSDLFFFFVPCVLGPVGEFLAVRLGAWSYTDSRFLLPLWLPPAWGIAMLFMKKTAETLLEPEERG